MKYVTEGLAEALYQRRVDESAPVDESKDWSGFKVRYTYQGDALSDYESTCILKAKDEKEAIRIAMKKVNAESARNFRIDGNIDSYLAYKKNFPHSGFEVFESVDEAAVVAIPHEFSSEDWYAKKVKDRIKIYLDYFEDAKKSGRKMKKDEITDNFRKLEKICLGIKDQEDYSNANALLNIADTNGFVYKKYVEKLVNDLRTGKKFNLKSTPSVVEGVHSDKIKVGDVINTGDGMSFKIKKMDSGKDKSTWTVIDSNGHIAHLNKDYVEKELAAGRAVVESSDSIEEAKSVKDYKFHVYVDRGDGKSELSSWFDDKKSADKEAAFMKKKGYNVEVKVNEEAPVKVVEAFIDEGVKVIKSGTVKVKKAFTEKEFDEDDGWVEIKIKPGTYKYQVLDFRGWKPRQLEVDGEWVDVQGDCPELEELLNEEYPIGEAIDEARWVTMSGRHVLVSDDGEIMAGGPGAKKKFSSGAIKAAVVSANAKSKK